MKYLPRRGEAWNLPTWRSEAPASFSTLLFHPLTPLEENTDLDQGLNPSTIDVWAGIILVAGGCPVGYRIVRQHP